MAALPDAPDFSGKTLEEGLPWCLMLLMAPDLDIRAFFA
jgi:hypothetical protein